MSRIDVSVNSPPFSNSNVQLYKYEPFLGNVFRLGSGAGANDTIEFTCDSTLNAFLVHDTSRQILFYSTNGPTVSGSNLSFTIQDVSGTQIMDSRAYTVNIGAGRFLPPTPTSIEFYKNEPIGNSALFIGSIPISTPASTISLPAGLGFVYNDVCSYYLKGTPLIQSPSSNYNILATGTPPNQSKLISINTSIRVSGERLNLDISGGLGISSNATVNQDISRIVVSGRCPPYTGPGGIYSNTNIRYSWFPSLPEGLRFTNSAGVALTSGDRPVSDMSSTIILQGSATNAAIRSLSSSNFDISLTGTRVSQPVISNTTPLRVVFKETVVFDDPNIRPLYKDASVNSSASSNSFYAQTKFALSGGTISNMTSSNLPTGLTLDFSFNAQRAFLRGKPTTVSTTTSTIRAINSNSIYADLSVNISVVADSVTLTSTADACSTFIVSRSLSNARTGYYKSPIQFTATSASGCNVTMNVTNISGTGLTFTGNSGSTVTYTLGGTPTTTRALTTSVVTARVTDTSVNNTTSFQYSIVPERYTFADASINAIQNVAITPVQITATTLSGRPVVWYASPNLPIGLSMDITGIITGTVRGSTNGTFQVNVSTGTTIDTCTFPYYVSPDSILLFAPQSSYTIDAGANVSIPITGLSYSGATVSNYTFSGLPTTGLTIDSSSGVITGPLSDSIPPNPILPAGPVSFDVCGYVGVRSGTLAGTFRTINTIVSRKYALGNNITPGDVSGTAFFGQFYTNDSSGYFNNWEENVTQNGSSSNAFTFSGNHVSEFRIKNSNVDGNVFMGTIQNSNAQIFRSTDGVNFYDVSLEPTITLGSLVYKDTSTWFAAGTDSALGSISSNLYLQRSDDDGLTWSNVGQLATGRSMRPRGTGVITATSNWYLTAGNTIAYKNGILMAGGNGSVGTISMIRSLDDGSNWTAPTGDVFTEVAKIYVDGSSRWIAVGSSVNTTGNAFSSNARTIMYSDTSGSSWTFANGFTGSYTDSSGSFNYIAYDVAYNGGVWLASGISWYTVEEEPISNVYKKELRASSNGVDWVRLDNVGATIPDIVDPQFPTYPYSEIGPIFYASNEWNVLIHQKSGDGNSWIPYIFTNSSTDVSGLTGIWQKTQTDLPMINSISGVNISNIPNYRGFLPSLYVRTGTPTQSTITFQNTTGGGPVFTSPTQVSYTVYQYMPIVPITFSATGTGTVYLFVNSGSLPTGLTWDPYTETIQGKTVNVGTYSFVVYAKDDVGITSLTITITTVIPRVIRQQTSAGAYTYLVKQYTEVNAAQEARDNRVTPAQDSGLGKFMAPTAPSVTTDSNCRC